MYVCVCDGRVSLSSGSSSSFRAGAKRDELSQNNDKLERIVDPVERLEIVIDRRRD